MKKSTSLLFVFLFAFSIVAFGHDSAKHKKQADTTRTEVTDTSNHLHSPATGTLEESRPLATFPTMHPLVVHIPIVFLLISAIMQVVSLFIFKKELNWTAWSILLVGFIGAYASSNWFHAHTTGLSTEAQHILEEHEKYAAYTQWLSGISLVAQSVNLFFLQRKKWLNIAVAIGMVAAATFVALAGHHGAELVHKHGIGAKGYKLEQHHH